MNPPPPSIIATRLKRAREARQQPTRPQPAQPAQAARPQPTPPQPTVTPRQTPQATRAAARRQAPDAAAEGKGSGGASQDCALAEREPLTAYLRRIAGNPEAIQYVSDEQLLNVWNGLVDGGTRAGHLGAADRAAFCAAVGLPFFGGRNAAQAMPAGSDLGGLLERASSRVSTLRRHAAVTQPDDDDAQPHEVLASEGDGHQMQEQAPVPEPAQEPQPPRFGSPRHSLGRALGLEPDDD